jgi:hypothetical protein
MIYVQEKVWQSMGRTGNKMFIHAYGNFLAKKNNLNWDCPINQEFPQNKITTKKNIGVVKKPDLLIKDESCHKFIEEKIKNGAEINGWFQSEELLNNEIYAEYISSLFEIKSFFETINKEDVFVHVRAGDIARFQNIMLPYEYYESQLNSINFKNGLISSDTPTHAIVQKLAKNFKLDILQANEEDTICIGASHSKIVLSNGSFSYWIGALSKPGTEILNITMNEAIKKYKIIWWHPSYDLKKARNYVDSKRSR